MTRRVVVALVVVVLAFSLGILVASRTPASAAPADLSGQIAELARQVDELRALSAQDQIQVLSRLEIPAELSFCGQPAPFDRPDVREAVAYELVLAIGRPTMPLLWMRRAESVLPLVEARLRQRGLPDDLKYLAMIESDLRLNAESPAGALGLWQFMGATARRYGLIVDKNLDERMDPARSTDAAINYLVDLQREFGDWMVAFAAYNAGEAAVRRALADQGPKGYFDMHLPYETRRYVPRLLAAKLLYEQPERYGLFRMQPSYVPALRTITVSSPKQGLDLREYARRNGLDYAALRTHNPQLRGWLLPAGKHELRAPEVR